MPSGLELLGRLLLAAVLGGTIGAGSYLLAVGTTVLVVLTLYGLGKFGNLIQRWGVSREEYVLTTSPDFDVERLVEVVRRENLALRGLERQETSDAAGSSWWSSCRPATGPSSCWTPWAASRACTRSSGSTSSAEA
jgi:uncharacterized membrane protein YhiD involved in acid resistance